MTDRDDWLEWRRGGIGGSDIAGVLGISPWASAWSVWADKTGLLPPEPESEVMAAGRWLESAIGPWFTHETGLHVAGEQTRCTHEKNAHHRCTVDGFVVESEPFMPPPAAYINDCALGLVEIKVTGPGRRWAEVPAHYQAQGQWQMHVTGLERVWFAVLMGRRLDIHELMRDQADIDYMVDKADVFWADHVLAGTPPPTDGSDATLRALTAVYPDHVEGQAVELDDELHHQYVELVLAKAAKAEATSAEKAAKAALAAAMGPAEELTDHGRRVLTYRKQTRVDRCAACGFETSSEFRVMRPVASKETP